MGANGQFMTPNPPGQSAALSESLITINHYLVWSNIKYNTSFSQWFNLAAWQWFSPILHLLLECPNVAGNSGTVFIVKCLAACMPSCNFYLFSYLVSCYLYFILLFYIYLFFFLSFFCWGGGGGGAVNLGIFLRLYAHYTFRKLQWPLIHKK